MHCLDHRSVFHMATNVLWAKSYLPPPPPMQCCSYGEACRRVVQHCIGGGGGGGGGILQQLGKKALCPTHFGQDCRYANFSVGSVDFHWSEIRYVPPSRARNHCKTANITYISPECLYDVWRISKFSNSTGSGSHIVTSFPVNKWSLELFEPRALYRETPLHRPKQDFFTDLNRHGLFVTLFWKFWSNFKPMCLNNTVVL